MHEADKSLYNLTNVNGPVIVSNGGYSPFHLLDKEARARIVAKANSIEKENRRKNLIRSNECPSCGGKLYRGKRNKNNDYKRDWACVECFEIHTI